MAAARDSEDDLDTDADDDADDGDDVPVASSKRKRDGRAGNRGANKRHSYSYAFKAEALDLLATAEGRGVQLQTVADHLCVSSGMLSAWRGQAERIYTKASDALTKNLTRGSLKKRGQNAKYPAMEKKLQAEVLSYRARGRLLSIRWLVFTARRLFDALYPDDAGTFLASRGWRRQFLKRYSLTRRKTTKTKLKSVTERLPQAREYHQKLVLLVTKPPPGKPDAPMDPKYGRFPEKLRFNMDECPLPFTSHRDSTIEEVGEDIVHVKQPNESLFKRQGTAVLWISPHKVMGVALIFRGKGTVYERERRLYDPRVAVLFQDNAWMNVRTMLEWVEKVFVPVAGQLEGEKLLLMDNLSAHVAKSVRAALRKAHTLAWYVPPGCTDFLQPVDAGAGRHLMQLYLAAQVAV